MVTPFAHGPRTTAEALGRLSDAKRRRVVTVNMGPQHPSTHGVLRLKVTIDGETIVHVEPVIGYLHRGVEKLFEDGSYLQAIPLTDRLDYAQAMMNNWALCRGVEELMGVKVPERAEYIRTAIAEIQRIASHFLWLGTFGLDIGAATPFFWCMRDREGAISLMERASGARLTYTWYRIGGVKNDLPDDWWVEAQRYCRWMRERIEEYDELLTENDIWQVRLQGTGILTKAMALEYGCVGPFARASGVDWDLRRDEPYGAYGKVKFDVPVRTEGDCYARYLCRLEEMRQSVDILEQCIAQVPAGDYIAPEVGEGARQHRVKPPVGEIYSRIESARGEMGVYIVSDGTSKPYRLKWRAPSFSNLQPLNDMVVGAKIPDLIATLGSTDIILGDLDR